MANKNHHNHSGDIETWYSDGSGYVQRADGGHETWYSDGSGYVERGDGSRETWYSDGSGYVDFADGGHKVKYSDGSGYSDYADGSRKVWYSDGSGYANYASGKYTSWNSKDQSSYSNSDFPSLGGTIASMIIGGIISHAINSAVEDSIDEDDDFYDLDAYNTQLTSPHPIIKDDSFLKYQEEVRKQQLQDLEIKRQERAARKEARIRFWRRVFRKKLEIPISSTKCKGMDYTDLIKAFSEAGFIKISAIPVDDLMADTLSLEGSVIGVSINNQSQFEELSKHRIAEKIIIRYHTVHLVYPPLTSKKAKNKPVDQIVRAFKDAGFINVETISLNDLKGWRIKNDKKVTAVSIDGSCEFSKKNKTRIDSREYRLPTTPYINNTLQSTTLKSIPPERLVSLVH